MRLSSAIVIGAFALAACGEREPAPTPTETVTAEVATSDAVQTAPKVLSAGDLRRVCRAGLAAIHGQDLSAIELDGLKGQVLNASWRAPVDGGRRRAQCRVDGDLVTWKQVDAPTTEQNRWMNQSGDPVIRYVLDGDAITINTTLPDGSTTAEEYSVAAEQEAR